MSTHARTVRLSGILGITAILVLSALGDDEKRRGTDATTGKRAAGSGREASQSVRETAVLAAQSNPATGAQPAPAEPETRRLPRVTVRDLRQLDRFHALDDERETFHRFLRFRGKLLDQGFPAGGESYGYGYVYDPFRSYVGDYIAISEYERARRERDRHRRDMEVRRVRLLTQHEKALFAGLRRLHEGDPGRAIVALTLAAKLNHGDPACRIHLAQARLALGHYVEAALALRRALQLQPKLVYADLHLDGYYEQEGALGRYTDTLAEWIQNNPARTEVHFLLGFLEFQRGSFEAAHDAFRRVSEAMPGDDLTRAFLEITKPAGAS